MYNFWSWYKKVIIKNIKTDKITELFISKQIIKRKNLKIGEHYDTEEIIVDIKEGDEKLEQKHSLKSEEKISFEEMLKNLLYDFVKKFIEANEELLLKIETEYERRKNEKNE